MKTELDLVRAFPGRVVKADFFVPTRYRWAGIHVFGEGIGPTLAVKEANEKVDRCCFEMGFVRPKGEWVWQGVNRLSGKPTFVLKEPKAGEVFVTDSNYHTK